MGIIFITLKNITIENGIKHKTKQNKKEEEEERDTFLELAHELIRNGAVSWLVSWCFKPSQLQRITSGLRETFIKRYIVERTSMAEIKPEEQSEKTESCPGNLWN